MPQKAAAAPTPLQVARYGHVAALLRAEMDRRGWKPGALNRALGKPAGHTQVYQWLAAKGAPSPETAKRVGKIFGIPWQQLVAANGGPPTAGTDLVVATEPRGPVPVRAAEVLHFSVLSDGTARLRMDMTAPVERGVALLRLLLDAGMVAAG